MPQRMPEPPSEPAPAKQLENARQLLVVMGLVVSFTSKLAPFGPLTWLARGYGHDVALSVVGYMLLRPAFRKPGTCALLTLSLLYLSEFLQFLIPEPAQRPLPVLGTFDWWDFVAFSIGTGLAFGVDLRLMRSYPHSKCIPDDL